ncbi:MULTISPECIES: hypothetical protein [Ruminococcus]|uniref:hypothetical protein n=1 Tax=Ruminococcus TaxID=1263 RepID=UPI0025CC0F57|nr:MULTISPECIES: hypothetical protein [Ruminococcus]MCR4639297.1 hypothetical protein [Ruminococcus sp.]
MSKNRNRVVSWIVIVVFSLVIFCSTAFIITHNNHNCTGDDCSICMELAECHKVLHTLGTAVARSLQLTLVLCNVAVICNIIIRSHSEHTTLISLKVKLLN